MTKGLSTHVLDLTHGIPAANLKIELWKLNQSGNEKEHVQTVLTNEQGRVETNLLSKFESGTYELLFYVGDYFKEKGIQLKEPLFLNQVPLRFGICKESGHYHVPLLISPWGYQTYRGS
ncbi:hydroxyisourate hydrolase [Bacillus sp. 03113]|uniref:hydroxyisourate hydrolase n=1 Tax=Bacillus sp. 03113 TaxID=2578211 RepID=UPI0011436C53|nr:hydroxyisourate hydrolase [Bacillus sp. 03113]